MKKSTFFGIILPIILVFVISSALILGYFMTHSKAKKSDYWKMKYDSFDVQNANLSKGQIVFVGDSITDLYPLDDYYTDLNLATYNRGIGGDTTGGLLDRMQVSIFDLTPSRIVLMIGINDIVGGGKNNNYVLHNYNLILEQISKKLPDTKVLCMSLLPISLTLQEYVPQINIKAKNTQVLEANDRIRNLAVLYGYEYYNLNQLVSDEKGSLDMQYSVDGLHLNAAGFEVWTNLLKPHLM